MSVHEGNPRFHGPDGIEYQDLDPVLRSGIDGFNVSERYDPALREQMVDQAFEDITNGMNIEDLGIKYFPGIIKDARDRLGDIQWGRSLPND